MQASNLQTCKKKGARPAIYSLIREDQLCVMLHVLYVQ